MEHAKARIVAEAVLRHLQPYCDRIEIAGSLRRNKLDVGDVELVCIPKQSEILFFVQVLDQYEHVKGKATGKYIQIKAHGINVDIFMATEDNWGYIYAIRTGNADFSKRIVGTWLPKHGYQCKDGYVWRDGNKIPVKDEKTLFAMMGISWIKPEYRI
jgi:DNA polymerase/3'-5' exonuclease PolX